MTATTERRSFWIAIDRTVTPRLRISGGWGSHAPQPTAADSAEPGEDDKPVEPRFEGQWHTLRYL